MSTEIAVISENDPR